MSFYGFPSRVEPDFLSATRQMYEGLIKFKDLPNRDLDYSSEGGDEAEANNTPVVPWRAQHGKQLRPAIR